MFRYVLQACHSSAAFRAAPPLPTLNSHVVPLTRGELTLPKHSVVSTRCGLAAGRADGQTARGPGGVSSPGDRALPGSFPIVPNLSFEGERWK